MLSALPSIASGTHNSLSSPATINPARNVVLKGDYVTVDLTAVGGGASGIIGAISYAPYTAPVTGDPYWANVTLMCNMEGADGSTVFTDDSGFNTLVAHGTVNIQNNLADFSGAGSDTSTSITAASIPSHDLPADFTIETSITFTDVSPNQYLFAVGNNGLILQLYLGIPRVYCAATGTSSPLYSNGPTLVDGVRYKLEVVRKSGVITAYCNGVSWGADATTQDFSADVYTIGNNGGGGLPARGMIGPTRVTKGVGRYTGGHTPDFGPFPTST